MHGRRPSSQGIDNGVDENLLAKGVQRILELEEEAQEQERAATVAAEARVMVANVSVKTPVTKAGSKAARRAASNGGPGPLNLACGHCCWPA
jgi:ABC-type branched-subunit amino acid transport system substrate-binding protein